MAPFKKIIKKLVTEELNKVNSKSTKQKKHITDDMPKFILKEGTWRLQEEEETPLSPGKLKPLDPKLSADLPANKPEAAAPAKKDPKVGFKLWKALKKAGEPYEVGGAKDKGKARGKGWTVLSKNHPARKAFLDWKAGKSAAAAEPEAAKDPMAAKKAALAKKKEKVAAMKKQKGDEHRKSGKIIHQAYAIYKALKGWNTDEDAVMKALHPNIKFGTVRDLYKTFDKVLKQKDDTDSGDLIDWLRDDGMDSVAGVVKGKMMEKTAAVKESKIRKISARRTKKKRS